MEKESFNVFQAREVAENYVDNIYSKTSVASAVVHVAVDKDYRCLSVSEFGEERKAIEKQCAAIFRVRYINGASVVNSLEYLNKENM